MDALAEAVGGRRIMDMTNIFFMIMSLVLFFYALVSCIRLDQIQNKIDILLDKSKERKEK